MRTLHLVSIALAVAACVAITVALLHPIPHNTVQTPVTSVATNKSVSYLVIKDFAGRPVKVRIPATRIVSEYGLATPYVYLLGAGNRLVVAEIWGPASRFYSIIDKDFQRKLKLARELSIEELLKLKPSLILVSYWKCFSRRVKQMEALGLPVFCVRVENVSDIYRFITVLGKVLGCEKRAEEIVSYYKSLVNKLRERLAGIETRPRVLILYYSGKEHAFRTFGGDMFQCKLVEMAGGVCVSANLSGKKTVNVEQVAKWNPDYIIVIGYRVPGPKAREILLSDPAWRAIEAVRDGRVYVVPSDGENWIDPCPKWVLGLYWLAKLLHPSALKDISIEKLASSFYEKLYNISLSSLKIVGDLRIG